MEQTNTTLEATFHEIEYIISIKDIGDKLTIKAEEKYSGEIWKNEIPAKYIEEITQKTGNFKKYTVFIKTLISALKKEDKNSYIDLLSHSDLELLKPKKEESKTEKQEVSKKTLNKKYFILTVCCETQRVHYPLPLNYEEIPDKETMRSTLQRIKLQLEQARKSCCSSAVSNKANSFYSSEPSQLEEENEKLKKKAALYELTRPGAIDLDTLTKSIHNKAKDIEKIKKETEKEINDLRNKLNDREKELEDTRSELSRTHTEWGTSQGAEDCDTLRKTLNDISMELENEKKMNQSIIDSQIKEIENIKKEMQTCKENERKASLKIKQLELELDTSIKKLNYTMYGTNRSSRANSNSSQKSSGYGKVSPAPRYNSSSKRTSSLPSSQKKPVKTASTKKPPNKLAQNSRPNRYSPSNPINQNRKSPYNSRSGSKHNTPTNKNAANRKESPAQRLNPRQNSNKPAVLPNKRVSPAPLKHDSVYNRLYSKPVQLTNVAKESTKSSAQNNEKLSQQKIENVGKELVQQNIQLANENEKLAKINQEIDSVNVNDIDKRLSKLQDLIKFAKS